MAFQAGFKACLSTAQISSSNSAFHFMLFYVFWKHTASVTTENLYVLHKKDVMSVSQVVVIILIVFLQVFHTYYYYVDISAPNWANERFLECGAKLQDWRTFYTLRNLINYMLHNYFFSIPWHYNSLWGLAHKQFSFMILYPQPCYSSSEFSFFCDTLWHYPSNLTSAYQSSLPQLVFSLFWNWLP
jgi:hypothetical protein